MLFAVPGVLLTMHGFDTRSALMCAEGVGLVGIGAWISVSNR